MRRRKALSIVLVLTLTSVVSLYYVAQVRAADICVTTHKGINVVIHKGPSLAEHKVGSLTHDTTVAFSEETQGWYHIADGWVSNAVVDVVNCDGTISAPALPPAESQPQGYPANAVGRLEIPTIGLDQWVVPIRNSQDTKGLTPKITGLDMQLYFPPTYILLNHSPGGFVALFRLHVGDRVVLTLNGETHTYEVKGRDVINWMKGRTYDTGSHWDLMLVTCANSRYARLRITAIRIG